MSEETENQPLSAEEEQQLVDLQHRRNVEEWSQREANRQAMCQNLQPVADAFGGVEGMEQMVADLEASKENLDDADQGRVDRIIRIINYDARHILAEHQGLSQPEPKPVKPS